MHLPFYPDFFLEGIMKLENLFTYHEDSRNLYKKFLKVFKLSVDTSSGNSIVFINEDTQVEIEFYFINHWIKYSIRYYNKNKDKMSYVYNYFWNRKDQTEFYFLGGDSDIIDYYITKYVNSRWFCVCLLQFCSVLCSKEVADVIGTNYFTGKYDELGEEKKSVEKIILKNIGGKYMFCVNVLGNSTVNELKQLGYYNIEDSDKVMIFEHKDNKSYIIIKQDNGNYVLNFKNNNNEKFLKSDWYLGNKDGVCCTDIFTIMEKPEFKKFCKYEQQEVIDDEDKSLLAKTWHDTKHEVIDEKTEEDKDLKSILLSYDKDFFDVLNNLDFGFAGANLDRLMFLHIKSNTVLVIRQYDRCIFYNFIQNEKDMFYNDGFGKFLGLTDKIEVEELYRLIKTRDFEIFLNKGIDNQTEENKNNLPMGFENVRIHEGKLETTTQKQIKDICDSLSDLLIYKNQKYGNSALQPNNIFYKGNAETSILIRLDDKLGRIINNTDGIRVNDVCDIIGYLVLYLVLKNISKADIEKLKD